MSIEADITRFVVRSKFEHLPQSAVDVIKTDIFDTLGTALAGSAALGSREVVELAVEFGGKTESSILVYGDKVPSPTAALANGTLAHALDFDDTHDAAVLHAGVSVVPAALAIAERLGKVSGKDFITAVALGVEVTCRMGIATRPWIGWILTSVYGYFGAAIAAGKLLGLDEEEILNTCGIAYAQAAGNLECVVSGALTKRIQAGFAAGGGVLSALMAQKGITGASESFLGRYGIFNLYQRSDFDPDALTVGLGEKYELSTLSFKPYPCCRWLHTPIDAALDLVAKHQFELEQIKEIEIVVGQKAWDSVGDPLAAKIKPRNTVDAQFSIPYTVAVALVNHGVKISDFTEEAIRNDKILEVTAKMRFTIDDKLEQGFGRGMSPTRVTVTTVGGETYSAEVSIPKGHPQNPMTEAEFTDKFQGCAAHALRPLPGENIKKAMEMLRGLENVENVAEIVKLLVVPAP